MWLNYTRLRRGCRALVILLYKTVRCFVYSFRFQKLLKRLRLRVFGQFRFCYVMVLSYFYILPFSYMLGLEPLVQYNEIILFHKIVLKIRKQEMKASTTQFIYFKRHLVTRTISLIRFQNVRNLERKFSCFCKMLSNQRKKIG